MKLLRIGIWFVRDLRTYDLSKEDYMDGKAIIYAFRKDFTAGRKVTYATDAITKDRDDSEFEE